MQGQELRDRLEGMRKKGPRRRSGSGSRSIGAGVDRKLWLVLHATSDLGPYEASDRGILSSFTNQKPEKPP